jgi:UTP--glucose-1-phosphate uridylyltransferase
VFQKEGKADKAAQVQASRARIAFVRQTEMRGTGHALLQVKALVGDDPCVVAYPDDLHFGRPPLAAQLIESWRSSGCSVLASLHEPGDVSRYGVLDIAEDGPSHVKGFVEKPARGADPSHEVSTAATSTRPSSSSNLEEGWKKALGGNTAPLTPWASS